MISFFFFFQCKLEEWENFEKRIGDPKSGYSTTDRVELIREWVSYRGQTLSRTGMGHEELVASLTSSVFMEFNFLFNLCISQGNDVL